MNGCEQAQRLSAYHDGELPAGERAAVEQHLERCAECRAELRRLERLSAELKSVEAPTLSPEAMARLHNVIDYQPALAIRRMAGSLAATAAAVLGISLFGLINRHSSADAATPEWESEAVTQTSSSSASSADDSVATWIQQGLSNENNK